MSEDVSSKVKKIVADHLGIDEAKVSEESSFIDDLGADSLDTVELVMAFEEEFGSEISDSDGRSSGFSFKQFKMISLYGSGRSAENILGNVTASLPSHNSYIKTPKDKTSFFLAKRQRASYSKNLW